MRILVYRYKTRLQNGCHYKLRVGSDSSQWWVDGRPCDSCQWHLCQHCQDIDQTKALEGLSKGLFLNLCWQAMTWWRRGWWIDCVLSLLSLFCSHSYFFRSLSPPLPLCPITLLSISPSPPASFFFLHPAVLIAWMCRAQDVRLFPSRHCAVWQRTRAVYHSMTLLLPPPLHADNIKYCQAFLIT